MKTMKTTKKRNNFEDGIILDIFENTNTKFIDVFFTDKNLVLLRGGAGSGKTYFLCNYIINEAVTKGLNSIFVTSSYVVVNNSILQIFQNTLEKLNIPYKIDIKNMTLEILKPFKTKCVFRTFRNVLLIKGLTDFDVLAIDEGDIIDAKTFSLLVTRIRGNSNNPKKILIAYNPLYSNLLKNLEARNDVYLNISTYQDNRFIDKESFEKTLMYLDSEMYKVYALGEWANEDIFIFKEYSITTELHFRNVESQEVYGVDFGFINPTAVVAVKISAGRIYVHEVIYSSYLTNTDLIEIIKKKCNTNSVFVCDNSEPGRISEMRKNGIRAVECIKNFKMSIDLIRRNQLFITETSYNLLREIKKYRFKTDSKGIILEEPVKDDDHAIDAMRYAVLYMFNNPQSYSFVVF